MDQQSGNQEKAKRPQILVERLQNIMGSTAGAGSGEFHHYRINKRRERARLAYMEREECEKKIQNDFEKQKEEKMMEVEKKTIKKKEKRQKKKQNKLKKIQEKKIKKVAQELNQFKSDGSFLETFLKESSQQQQNNNQQSVENKSTEK